MKNIIRKTFLMGWMVILVSCNGIENPTIEFPETFKVDTIPFSTPLVNYVLLEAFVNIEPVYLPFDTGSEITPLNSTIPGKRPQNIKKIRTVSGSYYTFKTTDILSTGVKVE